MTHVLVVDSDARLREAISDGLARSGYWVSCAENVSEGQTWLAISKVQAVIARGDADSRPEARPALGAACRLIAASPETPVLMVSPELLSGEPPVAGILKTLEELGLAP